MRIRVLTASLAAAICFTAVLCTTQTAAADTGANGSTDAAGNGFAQGVTSGIDVNGNDVTVNAGLTQGTGGTSSPASATTASTSDCTSQAVGSLTAIGLINQNPNTSISMSGDPGNGTWYVITCPGTTPSLVFLSSLGPQGAQQPLAQPSALAQEALATMQLPGPAVAMSPPSAAEIVNFQDWLWVDPSSWHPISATATAGLVSATATATPERVVYDMGTGAKISCNGPGTPYNPNLPSQQQSTNCSYTYLSSSAGQPNNSYTATATIYWSVRWTAVGAPGGGNLGQIPGATTSTSVEVDEIQSVDTAPR